VEDDVDAVHHLVDDPPVEEIALDDGHASRLARGLEVLEPAPHEVVQDHDLGGLRRHEIGDVRADQPGPAGNQDPLVLHSSALLIDSLDSVDSV
jgi:hypothetical protein